MYYKNLIRLVEKEAAMAVGERRNHSYQDANIIPLVAALMMQQQQPPHSTKDTHGHGDYSGDEQTVPKSYRLQNNNNLQQDNMQDPLTSYGQWLNNSTYPLNHNIAVYPSLQYGLDNATPAAQSSNVPSVARQISIPIGTESLEQYINNNSSLDYEYDQVFDNLDCTEYGNMAGFSLEDCVNLEKLHFPEDDNLNFEVTVKQEKPDNNGNIDKLNMMINNAEMNPNNNTEWSMYNNYPENVTVPTVTRSDQTVEELPDDVNFSNFMDGFYPTPQTDSLRQPLIESEEVIVKADPDEMVKSQCGEMVFQQQQNDSSVGASPSLPLTDAELIEMPVSRFNEFVTSLTPEQCNLAKDIRRRGKNKKAARLCRKRKIDNISSLEGGLTDMEEKKNKLLGERKQIVSETNELKRKIDSICEILIKGLNGENAISSSDISVLHHSKGHTLLVRE